MALSSVNVPPFGGDVGVVPIGSSQAYIWTHTTMNVGYIVASSHGTERLLSWNPVSPYIAKNGVSGNNPPTYPITAGHSSIVHHDALLLAYQFAQALL